MTVRAYLPIFPEFETFDQRRPAILALAEAHDLHVDHRVEEAAERRSHPSLTAAMHEMKPGDVLLTIEVRRLGCDAAAARAVIDACVLEKNMRVLIANSGHEICKKEIAAVV